MNFMGSGQNMMPNIRLQQGFQACGQRFSSIFQGGHEKIQHLQAYSTITKEIY